MAARGLAILLLCGLSTAATPNINGVATTFAAAEDLDLTMQADFAAFAKSFAGERGEYDEVVTVEAELGKNGWSATAETANLQKMVFVLYVFKFRRYADTELAAVCKALPKTADDAPNAMDLLREFETDWEYDAMTPWLRWMKCRDEMSTYQERVKKLGSEGAEIMRGIIADCVQGQQTFLARKKVFYFPLAGWEADNSLLNLVKHFRALIPEDQNRVEVVGDSDPAPSLADLSDGAEIFFIGHGNFGAGIGNGRAAKNMGQLVQQLIANELPTKTTHPINMYLISCSAGITSGLMRTDQKPMGWRLITKLQENGFTETFTVTAFSGVFKEHKGVTTILTGDLHIADHKAEGGQETEEWKDKMYSVWELSEEKGGAVRTHGVDWKADASYNLFLNGKWKPNLGWNVHEVLLQQRAARQSALIPPQSRSSRN